MHTDEILIEEDCPDDPSSATAGVNIKEGVYRNNYKGVDVIDHLVRFYSLNNVSLSEYVLHQTTIPKTSFRRHWKLSGLRALAERSPKPSLEEARTQAARYFRFVTIATKERTKKASKSLRCLSADEELAFVQLMRMMGNMGHGVTKLEALEVIDEYLNHKVDKREKIEVSEKILRGLLNRHQDLVKVISAGSLDPQRAKKANEETRDAVFTKLDCYIKNLYAMEKVTWRSYKDVPNDVIYNMDEVGSDTTKHRSKVIADAAAIIRKYQKTKEGDGKMNMHITACITTRADGKFRDIKNGIEGACGPVFIHTDKSKTKAKEAVERESQRNGETPSDLKIGKRFKEGFEDSPEILVASTHSGSMTQEIFYHYVNHFIESLPAEHGPVILFFDGHGSRWSVKALEKLLQNQVYPFFFASHTSIWAQPNDVGVNKRYHNSLEQVAKIERRSDGPANVAYFNYILSTGWQLFLENERQDLLEVGCNNTTNAYQRTGVYPLNPYSTAWMEAIETLGLVGETDELKKQVSYEVCARSDLPKLSDMEMEQLREGLELNAALEKLGDVAVACLRGEEMLKKWRMQIVEAVIEGEDIHEYARILLPKSVATTVVEAITLKLVEFQRVDVTKIALPGSKTKEEQAHEITGRIVGSTHVTDPIRISYLSNLDEDENNSEGRAGEEKKWKKGSAIKKANNKWKVFLEDDTEFDVTEMELLDSRRFYVEHAFKNLNREQRRKQAMKARRQRTVKKQAIEEELKRRARVERRESDKKEFVRLVGQITNVVESEGKLTYDVQDFMNMVDRLRTPFRTVIDGYLVAVSEAGSAVMMQDSALAMIKEKFLGEKRKNSDTDATTNKRQRTFNSGSAAVGTIFGACGYTALHHSSRRDLRQNKEARDNQIKSHRKEQQYIEKTLTMLEDRKKRCRLAKEKHQQSAARRLRQQEVLEEQQQQQKQQRQQQGTNNEDDACFSDSENSPVDIMGATTNVASRLATPGGGTLCTTMRKNNGSDLVRVGGGTLATESNVSTGETTGTATTPNNEASHLVGAATSANNESSHLVGAATSPNNESSHLVRAENSAIPTESTGTARGTTDTSTEEYWEITFDSKADDKKLFLRLFEPTSGVLSKKKEEQWAVIQTKILPQLSQAAMIAKEDTYRRRLSVLINELKELTEMDCANDSADGVNENAAETTEMDT